MSISPTIFGIIQTNKQTDKQTNKQTDIHKQTQIQTRMKTSGAGKNVVGCHEIETEANNF